MFVRIITPGDRRALDFELDFEYSRITPEVQQIAKEIICKDTGIQPELQNAVFCPESKGMDNIVKLDVPKEFVHLTTHPNGEPLPEAYEQSIVYVEREEDWMDNDFRKPQNRAEIKEDIQDAGTFTRTLYKALHSTRTVCAPMLDEFPDFRDAIKQNGVFHGFLEIMPATSLSPEVTRTELKCYDSISHWIAEGISRFRFRKFDSNRMHTMFFASMMMQLPFFSDRPPSLRKVDMAIEHDSGLHMFIDPGDNAKIHKITLQSDVVVIDRPSNLPTLICEVDFHASPKNRAKLIMQGMVACRQWRYVLPESIKDKNRFLGLFVRDNFSVDLYFFHASDGYKVELLQERFVLEQEYEALRLSRVLFNYRDKLLDIAGQAKMEKLDILRRIVSSSRIPPSLTPTRKRYLGNNRTHSFLFSAQVEALLCPDGALIQGTDHEYVAIVRMSKPPFEALGFIKVANKSELDAFEAIRKSESALLLNRVILPTKVVEVSGNTLIFLPYGGEPLEYSWGKEDGPLGHEVEIAWDLLSIVSRLHELHIAHLDIKDNNILWDTSTRSIRIIDFDSSELLDPDGSQKITGLLGTSGYAAPEVESEEDEYDPFLADAFSCGRVIRELVVSEFMTEEKWFLDEVAESLSESDVDERWSVGKAIESWTDWLKERGRPTYENRLFI